MDYDIFLSKAGTYNKEKHTTMTDWIIMSQHKTSLILDILTWNSGWNCLKIRSLAFLIITNARNTS